MKISFEILEEMIQCFGKCFHYKDIMASFMSSCNVPNNLVNKYRDKPKFIWARRVIEELSMSEEGVITQRRILTALCNLRDLPDKDVPDRNAGLDSLKRLKKLALENDLIVNREKQKENIKENIQIHKQRILEERSKVLEEIRMDFINNITSSNRHKAGYELEEILQKLFELNDIEYRKSFRNPNNTQQIDGYFKLDGFDYLVEAKWRKDLPNSAEISGFKHKVDSKLLSTRGLFVSINGFREEVVYEFSGKNSNIIFMDGYDLTMILEGRIKLQDALRMKIEKAAQIGQTFFSLSTP